MTGCATVRAFLVRSSARWFSLLAKSLLCVWALTFECYLRSTVQKLSHKLDKVAVLCAIHRFFFFARLA